MNDYYPFLHNHSWTPKKIEKKKHIQDSKKYISWFNMLHDTSFAYDMMAYGIWYNLKYMQEKMQALQLEKQRLENELRKVTHMVSKHIS